MHIETVKTIEQLTLAAGLGSASLLLGMIAWSIALPARRLWPPLNSTRLKQFTVWFLTAAVFVSAFVLGVQGWNQFDWPTVPRLSVGVPLIVVGNLVVWRGVIRLGLKVTGGEVGSLVTSGLYRHSRNPQYVADIAILLGWQVCCASFLSLPVVVAGVVVLLIAPLAEEPWLRAIHGKAYDQYCLRTRRYL